MGLIDLLFQKGYLFLRCMYILKTSKLLREEWRKWKVHNSQSASQSTTPVRAHKFFHSLKRDVPLSSWCGPVVSTMLGVLAFSSILLRCHILSLKTYNIFPLSLFTTFCNFEDVSIFNTCDLGWFLGALFSCLLFHTSSDSTFLFMTIYGGFCLEKLHMLELIIGFCLHHRIKASCIDLSVFFIHILSTGYKFYVFLVLTNVKLLFDFQHDKLEQSKVSCSDSITNPVHAR